MLFLKTSVLFLASLLAVASAAPNTASPVDKDANNVAEREHTRVILYSVAFNGGAYTKGELPIGPGAGARLFTVLIQPGFTVPRGGYNIWKMYKEGTDQYTFIQEARGAKLLVSPKTGNLVTAYSPPPAVFALESAGKGQWVFKLPNSDRVAEVIPDEPTEDDMYPPAHINFRPANGNITQRWNILELVDGSDWKTKPWHPQN
ncbi:hypothetical protein MKEN_00025500 [Mycena kentingensis (nom. inval.)]|nr:hypothetical protein MKEN_00025500 [Mycena kentingensis (nom. inval.)]